MKTKKELYSLLNEKREQILRSDSKIRRHVRSIKQGLHTASYQDAFIQGAYKYIEKI